MRKQSKRLTESKDDTNEIHKQLEKLTESYNNQSKRLEKLTESHNDLCKQLELHTKGTSGDDSAASRCCLLHTIYLLRSVVLQNFYKFAKFSLLQITIKSSAATKIQTEIHI